MTRIIIAALVALVISGPASVAAGQPYFCTIKSVGELGGNGLMAETEWAKRLHADVWGFLFDDTIGELRYEGFNISRSMIVVQMGTSEKDAIGLVGGTKVFHVSTSVDGMPFAFLDENILYTGSCDVI